MCDCIFLIKKEMMKGEKKKNILKFSLPKNLKPQRKVPIEQYCERCGKNFLTSKKYKKYCSPTCAMGGCPLNLTIENYIHPDGRKIKRLINGTTKYLLKKITSIESEMLKYLTSLGYIENKDFFREWNVPITNGIYSNKCYYHIDFCFPYDKIGIETDGGVWHKHKKYRIGEDCWRDELLTKKGYSINRFPANIVLLDDPILLLKRLGGILGRVKPIDKNNYLLKRKILFEYPPKWMNNNK